MATAVFVQTGDNIDYTPESDVAAGDVIVQADLIGVARLDIKAGAPGSLAVRGVFDFPKGTGSGTAIDAGIIVNWDATAKEAYERIEGSGSDKLLGKTVLAADETDTTVRVRLTP